MASIKQIQLNGVDYNLVDVDTLAALNNHISDMEALEATIPTKTSDLTNDSGTSLE